MSTVEIPAFVFVVDEIFEFASGTTVFVGTPEGSSTSGLLTPAEVELSVDGEVLGTISLASERMGGRRVPGLRSVETNDRVDVSALRGRRCVLVHRGARP